VSPIQDNVLNSGHRTVVVLTESEAEVRNKIQEMKILGAEEADLEIKIQKVNAKKRKVISYRI
jgi:hypothetical protein